jgi:sugar lactone lactonase YvrE
MTRTKLNGVLDGGRYFEGPRWHSGRLWFVDCLNSTLLSLEPSGECEQHAKIEDDTPCGLGILPDGKLVVLTMFRKRLMRYADGRLSLYADLSGVAAGTIDDMIVDGLGRAYVGDLGFDLPPPPDRGADGRIILVMPDGRARVVADGLRFPNGIAISADNSRLVVAEMEGDCLAEYDVRADGSLDFRRRFGSMKSRRHLPRSRGGRVGGILRRGRLHSSKPRRTRVAANGSSGPARHCLCSRRCAAADTVLSERGDVTRRTPAT